MKKSLILLATIPFIASCAVGGGKEFLVELYSAHEKISSDAEGTTKYALARISMAGTDESYSIDLSASAFEAKKGSESYKGDSIVLRTISGSNNSGSFFYIVESTKTMKFDRSEGSWPAFSVTFHEAVDESYSFYLNNTKLSLGQDVIVKF